MKPYLIDLFIFYRQRIIIKILFSCSHRNNSKMNDVMAKRRCHCHVKASHHFFFFLLLRNQIKEQLFDLRDFYLLCLLERMIHRFIVYLSG